MSTNNIIGSEPDYPSRYTPGFGSIRISGPRKRGGILSRVSLLILASLGCAIAASQASS